MTDRGINPGSARIIMYKHTIEITNPAKVQELIPRSVMKLVLHRHKRFRCSFSTCQDAVFCVCRDTAARSRILCLFAI